MSKTTARTQGIQILRIYLETHARELASSSHVHLLEGTSSAMQTHICPFIITNAAQKMRLRDTGLTPGLALCLLQTPPSLSAVLCSSLVPTLPRSSKASRLQYATLLFSERPSAAAAGRWCARPLAVSQNGEIWEESGTKRESKRIISRQRQTIRTQEVSEQGIRDIKTSTGKP